MSFDLFDSPELLDIQREGFYRFLNQGISHFLSKQFPIKVKNGSYSIELWLNEQNIKLIAPDSSPRDCILNMKTYSCKLYAQVKIVCKKQGSGSAYKSPRPCSTQNNVKTWERENIKQKLFCSAGLLSLANSKQDSILYQSMSEWVLLGQLPMMTKRGHFIINGSPRVIVHQVVRSPGIYFQKVVKKEDQNFARFYGDIIPLKGVWVRLQMTKKGRIEAKFKKGKKVQVEFLQKCLQVIEDQASLSESYWHDRPDFSRPKLLQNQVGTKRIVTKEEQSFVRAIKSTNLKFSSNYNLLYEDFSTLLDKRKNRAISKAEHDAFIYTYDKLYRTTQDKELEEWQRKKSNLYFFKGLNPENAFKRKKCSENLFASFKIPSRYDLGSLGREKINDKFGLGANYTNTKLTNSVACYCTEPRLSVKRSALLANLGVGFGERASRNFAKNVLCKARRHKSVRFGVSRICRCKADTLHLSVKHQTFGKPCNDMDVQTVRPTKRGEESGYQTLAKVIRYAFKPYGFAWSPKPKRPKVRFGPTTGVTKVHFGRTGEVCRERGRSFRVKRSLKKNQYLITQQRLEKEPSLYNCIGKKQELTAMDLSAASVWLYKLRKGEKFTDDIDHSQNRRVRTSGELLETQFENGVDRLKILLSTKLKEWRTSFSDPTFSSLFKSSYRIRYNDQCLFKRSHQISFAGFQNTKIKKFQDCFNEKFYKISVKEVFSTKPITGALREFFGSNPLSQYMDQTNPLAELTHKRRISSLGVGGVSRESAGMAIRGIHPTHYGRICPIETPEGKNAGLVNSLAFYTKVDVNGFLKTPYYRVVKGQIQPSFGFSFTSAKEELLTGLYIAPSDLQKSSNNILRTKNTLLETVPVRVTDNQLDVFKKESPNKVKLIGISPIQMISVATSLIPFLEHNDANRALMGSNMQRQAVPLMIAERPIVGTGLESVVIVESGHITESQTSGFAGEVTASTIIIDRLCLHNHKGSRALYDKMPKVKTLHVQSSALYRSIQAFVSIPFCASPLSKTLRIGTYVQNVKQSKAKQSKAFRFKNKALLPHAPLSARVCTGPSQTFAKVWTPNQSSALQRTSNAVRFVCKLCKEHSYKSSICMYANVKRKSRPWVKDTIRPQVINLNGLAKERGSFFISSKNHLTTFSRSNQNTCITEKPLIQEFDWVQKGDVLSDCSASNNGELAVGKNVLVAYIPWEGYNFEDAIVISERLVREHVYTSLHIERYTFQAQDLKDGNEWFTKNLPGIEDRFVEHLEESGLPKIGSFLKEGDIIVGKIRYLNKKPSSPYERLLCDILGEKNFAARNKSLYVPKGVEARVIYHRVINQFDNESDNKVRPARAPRTINVFLGEKRVIQVGDKISGRHGNKGVISTILPRQDMPYLPDGTPIDVILNPLGVPSRMNVGQVLECLLGLAANYLNQHFKITAFDERYGVEASKSIVFLKLYQARLQSGQNWLFQVNFPGKTRLVDGRSGLCFDQWITVGKAYILKLIHMVSEKIHARSTGPYALITQQPLRGRSNKGGQRLGEMEVWAFEGFGAAYTLQELLTKKSDDFFGRKQIVDSILPNPSSILDTLKPDFRIYQSRPVLGHPEIFKVLLCELQALCLDLGVYIVTPESFQRSFLGIVH